MEKNTGFLVLGVVVSFVTTILLGYFIYGGIIFINYMAPTQIFLNAAGGAFFFYALKHFGFKVGFFILLAVMILFGLFYTHVRTVSNVVRDVLFFFALGTTIFVYWKFVFNKFNFILRLIILAVMLAIADAILFMGIQSLFWLAVVGISTEGNWFTNEFIFGAISGIGLGIGFEITNLMEARFSGKRVEL